MRGGSLHQLGAAGTGWLTLGPVTPALTHAAHTVQQTDIQLERCTLSSSNLKQKTPHIHTHTADSEHMDTKLLGGRTYLKGQQTFNWRSTEQDNKPHWTLISIPHLCCPELTLTSHISPTDHRSFHYMITALLITITSALAIKAVIRILHLTTRCNNYFISAPQPLKSGLSSVTSTVLTLLSERRDTGS